MKVFLFLILSLLITARCVAALSLVQNSGLIAANSATSATTAAMTTTTGNTLVLAVVAKKASGGHTLTITDSKSNTQWRAVSSTLNPGTGVAARLYVCDNIAGGTGHTVTVTDNAASGLEAIVIEVSAPSGTVVAGDVVTSGSGTGTTAALDSKNLNTSGDLVFGLITQTTGGAVSITEGSGYTTIAKDEAGTNQPISVIYQQNVSTSFAPSWTFGSSVVWRGVAIAMRALSPAPAAITSPTWRYDARDSRAFDTEANSSLSEHTSGALAASVGSAYHFATGINNNPMLTVAASTGTGVTLPAMDLGTIVATIKSDGFILGANDGANGADGAYWLKIASTNLSAKIVTNSGSASPSESGGAGMNGIPIVVMLTATSGNVATITVNGFDVGTASISGTKLSATALQLFANYATGTASNQASGDLYEVRGYATPLDNLSDRRTVTQEMAWPFGPTNTDRVVIVSHNSSSQMTRASSAEGTTFRSTYRVSFIGSKDGTSRDCLFEGYDASTAAYYFCFTEYNFSNIGKTFGRMKSTGDFRLFIPAASVDCSGQTDINAGTNSPWSPMPVFNNGTLLGYHFTKSGTITEYYATVSGWPAAPVLATPTVIAGNSGHQIDIIPPSNPGNPSASLYRAYCANGVIQTASAATGTYTTATTLSGGSVGEGAFTRKVDSMFFYYTPTDSDHWLTWVSSDNGGTFGAVITTSGLTATDGAAIGIGQGGFLDRANLAGPAHWVRPLSKPNWFANNARKP